MVMSIIVRCSIRKTAASFRSALTATKCGALAFTHTIAREPREVDILTSCNGKALIGERLADSSALPQYLRSWEPSDIDILLPRGSNVVACSNISQSGLLTQNGKGHHVYPNGAVLQAVWKDGSVVGEVVCTYTDGSVYTGGWANNQKHGSGVVKYADGRSLCGEFVRGRIHTGSGTILFPSGAALTAEWQEAAAVGDICYTFNHGNTYIGTWADNSMHGHGTLSNTKCTYVGHFVQGVKCGEGKITYADGRTLEGTFKDNKIHNGVGFRVHADGTTATGAWVNGKLNGQGQIIYTDGQVLEGEFESGRIVNGHGVVVHASGDTESGTWVNGKLHGDGLRTHSTGQTLQGEFQEGRIHNGRGHDVFPNGAVLQAVWANGTNVGDVVHTYIDGTVYTGGWVNNRKHGSGVVTYADGSTLQGEFREGRIHSGKGTLKYLSGAALTTEWCDGAVVGDVCFTFPSGVKYTGGWTGHSMHGHGTLSGKQCTYVGHFDYGKKHGEGKMTYTDGRTLEGVFKDGKIYNGVGAVIHPDGNTESGTWVNGKLHGQGVLTYSTGQTLQGEFREGRMQTGKGTLVYPNGAVLTAEWLDGVSVGDVHYTFPSGTVYIGRRAADESMHGYGTLINAKYTYVGHFEHGKQCGEGKMTFSDGRTLEGTFKDDKIHNGVGTIVYGDDRSVSGNWVNGKLHWVPHESQERCSQTYNDNKEGLEAGFREDELGHGKGTLQC